MDSVKESGRCRPLFALSDLPWRRYHFIPPAIPSLFAFLAKIESYDKKL
jgi:hypothetical protein